MPTDSPAVSPEPLQAVFREEAPRRVYVKTDILKHIGYTPDCPGCRALQTGRTTVGHNDECRKRAVDSMKDTAVGRERISVARKREDDFLARAVQHSDAALAKKSNIEESKTIVLVVESGSGTSIGAIPTDSSMLPVVVEMDVSTPVVDQSQCSSSSSSSMVVVSPILVVALAVLNSFGS